MLKKVQDGHYCKNKRRRAPFPCYLDSAYQRHHKTFFDKNVPQDKQILVPQTIDCWTKIDGISRTNVLRLPDDVFTYLQHWRKLITTFVEQSHLITMSYWMNYDVCLQMYVLISSVLKVLLLQMGALCVRWWKTPNLKNSQKQRPVERFSIYSCLVAPWMHHLLSWVALKRRSSNSQHHFRVTVKVNLELEERFHLESLRTVDSPHECLIQH